MTMSSTYLSTVDATALAEEISQWLREQLETIGADRFVLGLSGGIDSAVVAGLCARAVGAERVLGVMMPSASNPADMEEAQKVADAFGIRTMTIDLTEAANTIFAAMPETESLFQDVLSEEIPEDLTARSVLARANVRPRIRMITLYYLANLTRGVVVGTGNKTEVMIGYFTKYGDGGVDLMALSDLYKYEVRAIARVIGVPESVITRPPSAGLWEGQTDEDEIGLTYEVLDNTLQAMEGGRTDEVEPEALEKVQSMVATSNHKRASVPGFTRNGKR
jgi:NAD+ synthase